MLRHLPGSRLWLPEPGLAWAVLIFGCMVIALGTVSAMRVRRHMHSGSGSAFELFFNFNRVTFGYWLHDYDEPDKWTLGILMSLRFPAVIGVLWAIAGLAF